jgi:hypothetical protein
MNAHGVAVLALLAARVEVADEGVEAVEEADLAVGTALNQRVAGRRGRR